MLKPQGRKPYCSPVDVQHECERSCNYLQSQCDVLLVSMPFGPQVNQPSLALSLLKASLHSFDIRVRVRYFTIDIAFMEPTVNGIAGEWVFNSALFGHQEPTVEQYVNDILKAGSHDYVKARGSCKPKTDAQIATILKIRETIPSFLSDCLAEVVARKPRIVGFTSTFQQHLASLALAKQIKECAPETVIVFGGANCEGVMGAETLRQFEFLDAVISGEADLVFPHFVERALAGTSFDDFPEIYTRRNLRMQPSIDLQPLAVTNEDTQIYANTDMNSGMDRLPFPDFCDFFDQFEAAKLDIDKRAIGTRIMFESSRGCGWGAKSHCTFCGLNGKTMRYRSKSQKRALRELEYLHEKYPNSPISTTDNVLDMSYFEEFIPALAERAISVELVYEVKANLKKEHVQMLAAAGCMEIQPGIESLIDDVLVLMRKGVRALHN